MSENLLTESLDGHRIRNIGRKVAYLDPENDQIVREILRQFCPKTNCSTPHSSIEENFLPISTVGKTSLYFAALNWWHFTVDLSYDRERLRDILIEIQCFEFNKGLWFESWFCKLQLIRLVMLLVPILITWKVSIYFIPIILIFQSLFSILGFFFVKIFLLMQILKVRFKL